MKDSVLVYRVSLVGSVSDSDSLLSVSLSQIAFIVNFLCPVNLRCKLKCSKL